MMTTRVVQSPSFDLAALVATLAEASHGQPEDLSSRRHDLAARLRAAAERR